MPGVERAINVTVEGCIWSPLPSALEIDVPTSWNCTPGGRIGRISRGKMSKKSRGLNSYTH